MAASDDFTYLENKNKFGASERKHFFVIYNGDLPM